jgi:hypothetical protein
MRMLGERALRQAQDRRWLSNEVYRNQASGLANNPLGLDTSLFSYSTGAGFVLFPITPQTPIYALQQGDTETTTSFGQAHLKGQHLAVKAWLPLQAFAEAIDVFQVHQGDQGCFVVSDLDGLVV